MIFPVAHPVADSFRRDHRRTPGMYRITGHYPMGPWTARVVPGAGKDANANRLTPPWLGSTLDYLETGTVMGGWRARLARTWTAGPGAYAPHGNGGRALQPARHTVLLLVRSAGHDWCQTDGMVEMQRPLGGIRLSKL